MDGKVYESVLKTVGHSYEKGKMRRVLVDAKNSPIIERATTPTSDESCPGRFEGKDREHHTIGKHEKVTKVG